MWKTSKFSLLCDVKIIPTIWFIYDFTWKMTKITNVERSIMTLILSIFLIFKFKFRYFIYHFSSLYFYFFHLSPFSVCVYRRKWAYMNYCWKKSKLYENCVDMKKRARGKCCWASCFFLVYTFPSHVFVSSIGFCWTNNCSLEKEKI